MKDAELLSAVAFDAGVGVATHPGDIAPIRLHLVKAESDASHTDGPHHNRRHPPVNGTLLHNSKTFVPGEKLGDMVDPDAVHGKERARDVARVLHVSTGRSVHAMIIPRREIDDEVAPTLVGLGILGISKQICGGIRLPFDDQLAVGADLPEIFHAPIGRRNEDRGVRIHRPEPLPEPPGEEVVKGAKAPRRHLDFAQIDPVDAHKGLNCCINDRLGGVSGRK